MPAAFPISYYFILLWIGDNIDMAKRYFFSGFQSVEFLILKSDITAAAAAAAAWIEEHSMPIRSLIDFKTLAVWKNLALLAYWLGWV